MTEKRQKLFSMRTDNDEGEEFLAALDFVRSHQYPVRNRTDMVKELVFKASADIAKEFGPFKKVKRK